MYAPFVHAPQPHSRRCKPRTRHRRAELAAGRGDIAEIHTHASRPRLDRFVWCKLNGNVDLALYFPDICADLGLEDVALEDVRPVGPRAPAPLPGTRLSTHSCVRARNTKSDASNCNLTRQNPNPLTVIYTAQALRSKR